VSALIPALQTRDVAREYLDQPTLDLDELHRNLREMAMLNRLPGGVAASMRAIDWLLEGAQAGVVLDVGTGSGDLPMALAKDGSRHLRVLASDLRPEVLEYAAHRLQRMPRIELFKADIRQLPLADESVDVAHSSLLVHHLDPADAVRALGEMRRVARRGVVVNDLRRGRLAFTITRMTVLGLARARYTRHDGVLSARRAYTLAELDELAESAGLRRVRRSLAFLPRVVTVYR
jgi:ubiquinone/menaquinone biosynthesis C-methylase UbiE